jgi:hypothetical protein
MEGEQRRTLKLTDRKTEPCNVEKKGITVRRRIGSRTVRPVGGAAGNGLWKLGNAAGGLRFIAGV